MGQGTSLKCASATLHTHVHYLKGLHRFDEDHALYRPTSVICISRLWTDFTGLASGKVKTCKCRDAGKTRKGGPSDDPSWGRRALLREGPVVILGRVLTVGTVSNNDEGRVWLLLQAMTAQKATSALQACIASAGIHKRPWALVSAVPTSTTLPFDGCAFFDLCCMPST